MLYLLSYDYGVVLIMPKKTKDDHADHNKDQQELQSKYIQYQLMRQQLTAYTEEKALIDEKLNELNSTIDALHRLGDVKKGEEVWSPLGSGSFVRSDIKDTDNVMIAIGAGVVVRETKERSIEILQGRLEELADVNNDLTAEMTKLTQVLEKLEPELEMLAHKVKNG